MELPGTVGCYGEFCTVLHVILVASLNTHHGVDISGQSTIQEQVDLLGDALGGSHQRLLLLQECDRGMARSGGIDQPALFAQRLKLPYIVFGANLQRDGGQYGTAVLSDVPVLEASHHLLPIGDGGSITHIDGSLHGREQRGLLLLRLACGLDVVNVHASIWAEERLAMRGVLESWAAARPGPLLIGGDFNSDDPLEDLQIPGLRDACVSNTAPTFPSGAPRARIDRLLGRGVEMTGYCNTATELTDHHLVTARLTL